MTLRSRSSVRDRPCPELDRLLDPVALASRDARYAAITRLLDDATATIDDPAHRAAAACLLGSGPDRWRTVAQRGADAAAVFGCGWDAYRRRRSNGTSQLDDTLHALATALAVTAADPGGSARAPDRKAASLPTVDRLAGADPSISSVVIGPDRSASAVAVPSRAHGSDPDPQSPTGRPAASRHRRAVISVAVLAAVVLAAGFAYQATRDTPTEPEAANPLCDLLDKPIGHLPAGADAEMQDWAERFRVLARTLPPSDVACAGTMERQDDLVVQPVAGPDAFGIGALVSTTQGGSRPIHLDYVEHTILEKMRDRYGPEMVGTPVRRDDHDGERMVVLTRGAIVGESWPLSFIVVGRIWQEWIDRGGADGEFGRPVSQMREQGTERFQDFEHGRLFIDLVEAQDVRWEPITNPSTLLPLDVRHAILRAHDGTSWYVDDDRVRHWIPTLQAYRCTAGLDAEEFSDVAAQAIVTLTPGEPFRCE